MLCARVMRGISSMAVCGGDCGERLTEADHRLTLPHECQVGGARLGVGARRAHLQDDVGEREHFFARGRDAHAFLGVFGVKESGADSGARFQDQLAAHLGQDGKRTGHHGYTALAG